MRTRFSISGGIGKFGYYGAAAALSLLVVLQVFKFWAMDWHALMDEGDAIYHAMVIKTITDTGWHFENPHLGAPGVFQLYNDPVFVTWDSLLIKFLGFLISNPNPIVLYNIYFLLSFPLTAISALLALRIIGIARLPAFVGAVLYSVLTSHLTIYTHLFRCANYIAPWSLILLVGLISKKYIVEDDLTARMDLSSGWKAMSGALLISAILGLINPYYVFFHCFLFMVGALFLSVNLRSGTLLARAFISVLITAAVFALTTLLPIYLTGEHVPGRAVYETENNSIKLFHLLLPHVNHRLEILRNLTQHVFKSSPNNGTSSLGIFCATGLLCLIGGLLFNVAPAKGRLIFKTLAAMTLAALLYGIVGGLATAFSIMVTPIFRVPARIDMFISFFGVAALALILGNLYDRLKGRLVPFVMMIVFLAFVLAAGIFDQTFSCKQRPDLSPVAHNIRAATLKSDVAFVARIESACPPGAKIFQLPVVGFPDDGFNKMSPCAHFVPYLYSKNLCWTYGAGTALAWQKAIAAQPPDKLADDLIFAGFSGLYLDAFGYNDADAIVNAFRRVPGLNPVFSGDGRRVFISLHDRADILRRKYSNAEIERRRAMLLGMPGGSISRTQLSRADSGTSFSDMLAEDAVLSGLIVYFGNDEKNAVIRGIRPLYDVGKNGVVFGKQIGESSAHNRLLLAKKGYAVGEIFAGGEPFLQNFKVVFMRIKGNRLDVNSKYETEWTGDAPNGHIDCLQCGDNLPVGIHGTISKKGVGTLGLFLDNAAKLYMDNNTSCSKILFEGQGYFIPGGAPYCETAWLPLRAGIASSNAYAVEITYLTTGRPKPYIILLPQPVAAGDLPIQDLLPLSNDPLVALMRFKPANTYQDVRLILRNWSSAGEFKVLNVKVVETADMPEQKKGGI